MRPFRAPFDLCIISTSPLRLARTSKPTTGLIVSYCSITSLPGTEQGIYIALVFGIYRGCLDRRYKITITTMQSRQKDRVFPQLFNYYSHCHTHTRMTRAPIEHLCAGINNLPWFVDAFNHLLHTWWHMHSRHHVSRGFLSSSSPLITYFSTLLYSV